MNNIRLYAVLLLILLPTTSQAQNWAWVRGNTGTGMDGWPVATDNAGNVFVAGITFDSKDAHFGSINVGGSLEQTNTIIAKYDPSGKILWAEGSKDGRSWLYNIATDLYGNVYLFGSYQMKITFGSVTLTAPDTINFVYYLVKYDKDGHVVWAKSGCNVIGYISVGSISYVLGAGGVSTDATGNIYICNSFKNKTVTIGSTTLSNVDATGNTYDIFIAKYDQAGNVVWAISEGGTKDDMAFGITVTPAGDIYIAGDFGSPTVSFGSSTITNLADVTTAYIARFNATGMPVWATSSGGTGGEYAVGVIADADNNVYLTGGFKDNRISFSGTTIMNTTSGKPVLYLVKFNPSNNVDWYKTIKSTYSGLSNTLGGAWGYSIALSLCGIVYVSGAGDSLDIDGHLLSLDPNSISGHIDLYDPIFIAGYTTSGNYVRSAILPSGGDDQNGIACDAWGNLYLCSDYGTGVFFAVGKDTLPNASGGENLYVARYSYENDSLQLHNHNNISRCFTGEMELNAPPGFLHYLWSTNDTNRSITISSPGTYYLHAFDSCSSQNIDSVITLTEDCHCINHLFVPNAFTPNGDGVDDVFYPRSGGSEIKLISSFRIYNRWGELIFEKENILPNDATKAWDGSYKGEPPLPEVYVWVVEGICDNGKQFNSKGSVTIIR